MRIRALFLALSFAAGPALADQLPAIEDPIFHLTLRPGLYEKGFTAVPQDLLRACGVEVKADASYRYWLLASADEADGRYLMIGGLVKARAASGAAAEWSDDKKGSFLRVTAAGCTPIDPADEVFAYYQSYAGDVPMKIGTAVFTDLATDAVHRFAQAFGSMARFVDALREQKRYPDLVVLKTAIEAVH